MVQDSTFDPGEVMNCTNHTIQYEIMASLPKYINCQLYNSSSVIKVF